MIFSGKGVVENIALFPGLGKIFFGPVQVLFKAVTILPRGFKKMGINGISGFQGHFQAGLQLVRVIV